MFNPIGIVVTAIIVISTSVLEVFLVKRSWLLGLILPVLAIVVALIFEDFNFWLAGILFIVFIATIIYKKTRTK